ncbi:MAG: helix-turn-helix transcriptional regulator [Lentisphaeria bacterium]|nr:helix-turn-helix transcriptional regulator [Lentisphaeria bacterium]
MTDEITYLENIRNSLLHLQNLPLVLCVNNDKLCRKSTSWNTAKMHLHELFEMRILFGLSGGQVDYCKIEHIHLTPPQILHKGLNDCDLSRHLTLRLGANEIYYIRGKNNVIYIALSPELQVPGVSYAELAAALAQTEITADVDLEHTRLLMALLLSTLRQLLATGKNTQPTPAEVIANCIRENYYRSDLSIREIAEITRFSPNYIQQVFRAGWNCTPIEYLNEVRLNAARQLLRQHRWQVKEVAAMCGWNYVHYFCRRYKEHFGNLPGEE